MEIIYDGKMFEIEYEWYEGQHATHTDPAFCPEFKIVDVLFNTFSFIEYVRDDVIEEMKVLCLEELAKDMEGQADDVADKQFEERLYG